MKWTPCVELALYLGILCQCSARKILGHSVSVTRTVRPIRIDPVFNANITHEAV